MKPFVRLLALAAALIAGSGLVTAQQMGDIPNVNEPTWALQVPTVPTPTPELNDPFVPRATHQISSNRQVSPF